MYVVCKYIYLRHKATQMVSFVQGYRSICPALKPLRTYNERVLSRDRQVQRPKKVFTISQAPRGDTGKSKWGGLSAFTSMFLWWGVILHRTIPPFGTLIMLLR